MQLIPFKLKSNFYLTFLLLTISLSNGVHASGGSLEDSLIVDPRDYPNLNDFLTQISSTNNSERGSNTFAVSLKFSGGVMELNVSEEILPILWGLKDDQLTLLSRSDKETFIDQLTFEQIREESKEDIKKYLENFGDIIISKTVNSCIENCFNELKLNRNDFRSLNVKIANKYRHFYLEKFKNHITDSIAGKPILANEREERSTFLSLFNNLPLDLIKEIYSSIKKDFFSPLLIASFKLALNPRDYDKSSDFTEQFRENIYRYTDLKKKIGNNNDVDDHAFIFLKVHDGNVLELGAKNDMGIPHVFGLPIVPILWGLSDDALTLLSCSSDEIIFDDFNKLTFKQIREEAKKDVQKYLENLGSVDIINALFCQIIICLNSAFGLEDDDLITIELLNQEKIRLEYGSIFQRSIKFDELIKNFIEGKPICVDGTEEESNLANLFINLTDKRSLINEITDKIKDKFSSKDIGIIVFLDGNKLFLLERSRFFRIRKKISEYVDKSYNNPNRPESLRPFDALLTSGTDDDLLKSLKNSSQRISNERRWLNSEPSEQQLKKYYELESGSEDFLKKRLEELDEKEEFLRKQITDELLQDEDAEKAKKKAQTNAKKNKKKKAGQQSALAKRESISKDNGVSLETKNSSLRETSLIGSKDSSSSTFLYGSRTQQFYLAKRVLRWKKATSDSCLSFEGYRDCANPELEIAKHSLWALKDLLSDPKFSEKYSYPYTTSVATDTGIRYRLSRVIKATMILGEDKYKYEGKISIGYSEDREIYHAYFDEYSRKIEDYPTLIDSSSLPLTSQRDYLEEVQIGKEDPTVLDISSSLESLRISNSIGKEDHFKSERQYEIKEESNFLKLEVQNRNGSPRVTFELIPISQSK